jgi:hypothetical protein
VLKRRCRLFSISRNKWSLISCWNVYKKIIPYVPRKRRSGRRSTDVFIVSALPLFCNSDFGVTFSRWRWFSLLTACGSTSVCMQFTYPARRLQSRLSLSGANRYGTNRVWTGAGVTALNAAVFDIGAALTACRCLLVFKPSGCPSCVIMYVEWKRRPMRGMLAG